MKRTSALLLGFWLFTVSAGWWTTEAFAQSRTSSAVRGSIVLTDGTPVQDVAIVLRHTETGNRRTGISNEEGRYLISLLQPGGPYTLTVSHLGFSEASRENIMLQVGETHVLDIVLQEEALQVEGIEVAVERTEIFNPSQVGPATRLDEITIEAIPLISRNFMDLAILSPLVKKTESGGFSIAGQNDRYNSILVDGASNKDAFGLSAGGVPGGQAGAKILPLDAVSQFEILIAPFDVRLSGFTGGVMNAVTRTGTNRWRTRGFVVHRTEGLIGDLNLPTGPVDASGVDRTLVGFSVGGPIIRDKAHFFVTGEFENRNQPPTGFNVGRDDAALVRVSPGGVESFQNVFEPQFGLDTGIAGPFTLEQELVNIFARVDWNFDNGNRLTVRNVFANANNDESPNRSAFEAYELSSNAVLRSSMNNTASIHFFSDFGTTGANELDFTVQRITDETTPASLWPQVSVDVISTVDGTAFQREVRGGSQFFAQDNDLKQTTYRLTNSTTLINKRSTYTLGATVALYDIEHRFLPGSTGDWFFASVKDVEENAPQRFQRTVLRDGQAPEVDFSVLEWGIFVQNEIDAGDGLTMRFGIRIDVPHVLDKPEENPAVLEAFGRSTSNVPSGTLLLSPRWGFNWQSDTRRQTQVRMGAGMFVGQLPFVWLSNAFHNNGLRSVTQVCTGRRTDDPLQGNVVPAFDPVNAPTTCLRGPPIEIQTITLFDKGFKYPREFKFSAGVDQELSETISMSLGLLYSRAANQVAIEDLNLGKPSAVLGPLEGYGGFDRRYFGRPVDKGFAPNRPNQEFDHVLLATNDGKDWSFAVTAELRGQLGPDLRFQAGYSFSRSFDRMSLMFADMMSNLGFNPTSGDPAKASIRTSNFDRPHKIVLTVFGAPIPGLRDTEISLLYTGQSGLPFSYVYRGDLNGDGFPGLGGAFDRNNDLVYVPNDAGELPSSGFATLALLSSALERDECLSKNRGKILRRNACRAPWQNTLDVRASHTFRTGGAEFRFEADMINFLNLLNSSWGNIESIRPVVSLLEPVGRGSGLISGVQELKSRWAGAVLPSRSDDGRLLPSDPWSVVSPASQWQAQFGLRITLDQSRR